MKKLRWGLWIIVGITAGLFGLFAYQLTQPKDEFVKSAMVGQPVPAFDLPAMVESRPGLSSADLANGEAKLLNIFASWCIPCAAEAPFLEDMARQGVPIAAVAITDTPQDIDRFLRIHGNPFTRIGDDRISEVQFALGSSGVPETFVIAGDGTITYQHIGDIRSDDVATLMDEWRKAAAR